MYTASNATAVASSDRRVGSEDKYRLSSTIYPSLPIYLYDASTDIVPIYEVWIGYVYLGTLNSCTPSDSTTIVELVFDWGELYVSANQIRRLKTLGKFRQELGRKQVDFKFIKSSEDSQYMGYLFAGNHLLNVLTDKAVILKEFRQIRIRPNYLQGP